MCNAFNSAKKPRQVTLPETPDETTLIRRTDPAPVQLPSGEITLMRWGFQRPRLGVINNTRSDKLESPMWQDAIAKRRCLIPIASYYEWTGPSGQKQTHLFHSPDRHWLWIAGIWEDHSGYGPCFSMLTTDANSLVSPIHPRMPAILTPPERETYLQIGLDKFAPAPELLVTAKSLNPLLKNPPTHIQEELF